MFVVTDENKYEIIIMVIVCVSLPTITSRTA